MNKFSKYLKKKKPLLKVLISKLGEKYEFASVLATDVSGKNFAKDKNSTYIVPSFISECGFVVRVFKEGVYSEYSFSEIEEKDIDKIVCDIDSLVSYKPTIDKINCRCMQEDKIEKKFKRNMQGKEFSDSEIVDELTKVVEYGLNLDKLIVNARARIEITEISKMYISKDKDLEQYYTWANLGCTAFAKKGDAMKYAYDGFGTNNVEAALAALKQSMADTVKLAIELLDAKPATPGVYTIITDPSITGLFAHEAFGHGLEMDQFVKERAVAMDYMGKRVAKPILNMHDGAKSTFSVASYFFDDEGALAGNTQIIKKGILNAGICDSISASILGLTPTGNGRRQSYKRKSYTRMTNTFFDKGKDKLEDMIASVDYGYYISTTNNGMEDPKNWGIQCTALYGREIVNGKFSGKIISPVVMSGYVIDFLESISMISSENFNVIGSGSCGKGYKEWVRVSDGGASLKAEVKIG